MLMSTASPHKGSRPVNNDPWAVLIALASLIIVATIAAIIVVCILWRRYRRKRAEFERSLQQVVYQHEPQEYEIQSLDMFVPQEDREDLGEVHVGFTPTQGIQTVHHVKEIQMQKQIQPHQQQENPAFNRNEIENLDESIKIKDTSLYKRVMHYSKLGGQYGQEHYNNHKIQQQQQQQ